MITEFPLRTPTAEYTLHYSSNAVCRLEAETEMTLEQISNSFNSGKNLKVTLVRALVWAGLGDRHPGLSLEDAGRIIDEVGIVEAVTLAAQAFQGAFPRARSNSKNPQTAVKGGTSKHS